MKLKAIGSSDDYVSPSSSKVVISQALNGGTIINLEQRRMDLELAMREIEKKKIREEILMKVEMFRRRELEEEVIRDLMVEGKIPVQLPPSISALASQTYSVGADMSGPLLDPHKGKQTELEDSHVFPFQREPKATTTALPKPVFNLYKDAPVNVVKPVSSVPVAAAATKRKLESVTENGEGQGLSTQAKKKSQVEWSCNLCNVKTTCEDNLKGHLNGKKHKVKERALFRAQAKAAKKAASEMAANETAALAIEVAQPPLSNASKRPAVDDVVENRAGGSNKLWCTMCNYAAMSEAEMNTHKMGNSHVKRFMENGGFLTNIQPMI